VSAAYDLAIIGAGPAGMSAALGGAALGLRVVLIDEQPEVGGQIYRNIGAASPSVLEWLGPDYAHGRSLVDALTRAGVTRLAGASVWDVSPELDIHYLSGGETHSLRTRHLVVAAGAMERPSPLPGWTLPGVMNAGAAQIMMKTAAAVPSGRVVLVGGGPLLYLVAVQLLDAGADVAALVETSPRANMNAAIRHAVAALRAPGYLFKGMRMLAKLRAAGVCRHVATGPVRVLGAERAEAVEFQGRGGVQRLAADLVLLHHGVIPNVQLTRMLRLEHEWSDQQLAWWPRRDEYGRSRDPRISIAGDGAGIAGARAAEAHGAMTVLDAARQLGAIDESEFARRVAPLRAAHAAELRIRPFLDTLYRPPEWLLKPEDDTIVCRCEEVTAGQIREMATLGCRGPNQTKFFSRCGMGPCQGRMCGTTVTHLLAEANGIGMEEVGYYRIRPPLKPIPLVAMASAGAAAPGAQPPHTEHDA
jgi:NADPH-dependent 2,4-dienoyl-CoA reductase/sulfur reductase-like enzyme